VITSAGNIQQCTNVAQGDTIQTRTGNLTRVVSWLVKFTVKNNVTASDDMQLRVLLVLDKQTNGAIFTPANLLNDTTINDSMVSPLQLNSRMRLKILRDKVYNLSPGGSNNVEFKKFYLKFNLPLVYEANNGTIADLRSNSLSVAFFSTEATDGPTVTFFSRIRFVDS